MIDPKLLRASPDVVAANLARRGFNFDVPAFASLEDRRKTAQIEADRLRAERNANAKQVGMAKGKGEDAAPLLKRGEELTGELARSEAGLNDGLAFPFVWAAVAAATTSGGVGAWVGGWLVADVLGRIVVGVAVGWVIGRVLGRVSFRPPGRLAALADTGDGFVALAATCVAYGVTELLHGYGFLAVFMAAVGLRSSERGHDYHRVLHAFAGEVEQVMTVLLLVLLGGAATTGLLGSLTWTGAAVGLGLILVVRPVAGAVSLIGMPVTKRERRAIAFFGIRGVGSIYYLAFAVGRADFAHVDELWAITLFTILASILIHGVTATPIMERLDRRREIRLARAASLARRADRRSQGQAGQRSV